MHTKTMGPNHPNTAVSQVWLAALLDRQYRFTEAEELYQLSGRIFVDKVGSMHPSYVATVENHALSFWSRASILRDCDDERLDALDNTVALLGRLVNAKRDGLKRGDTGRTKSSGR